MNHRNGRGSAGPNCNVGPRARMLSHVEIPHELGVLLDELPPRLDLVAHQRLEQFDASRASSIVTLRIVRVAGSIVVFHSWSGFISPRPL